MFNIIKNKVIQNLLITLVIISLNSCGVVMEPMPKSWNWGLRPRPLTGVRNFPETDTDYGKGFKAGCESAWDQSTKGLKDIVKPHMNPVLLATNPDYSSGWFDGSEQCTYIVDWDVT